MSKAIINAIKKQLLEVQEGGLWLAESFKGKIESLTDEEALMRPMPAIHSVAELVSHLLVWRKEAMLRMKGSKTELMESPDNWKNNEDLTKIGWPALKQDFYQSQAELIAVMDTLEDHDLERPYLDTGKNLQHLLEGLVHHDMYHLGQIGITVKLLKEKSDA